MGILSKVNSDVLSNIACQECKEGGFPVTPGHFSDASAMLAKLQQVQESMQTQGKGGRGV